MTLASKEWSKFWAPCHVQLQEICTKFNWNLQREKGFKEISLPWGRNGYVMELYNSTEKFKTLVLSLFVHSDNTCDQKGKKSTQQCLMTNSPSASKRVKTDIGNDNYDDEVYEKFMQGPTCTDSKNENAKWSEVHIELRKMLEKLGTSDHFGVVHLSSWTDLIVNGTVSGVDEEPDWSKYRHITSVDPMPKSGTRLSTPRMSASSQDMITTLMFQQEARREEERKLEAERRREQERKWQEIERQYREQHFMTMSIISKALLPGMPSVASHPDKEVVHSEPSKSKQTGQTWSTGQT